MMTPPRNTVRALSESLHVLESHVSCTVFLPVLIAHGGSSRRALDPSFYGT
jgi:hypothetical protein